MKIIYKIISLFFLLQILSGCASQSAKMAHKINNDKDSNFEYINTVKCQEFIAKTNTEDYVFNGRMVATPIIGILGLFSAPLILAANVTLDVKDRLIASNMSENCGGDAIEKRNCSRCSN